MNLELLKDFFLSYSLPTIIIAIVVAILNLLVDLLFKKFPLVLKNYLPFVLSILIYFAFDMIKMGEFTFSLDAFYCGILTGSLSTVIYSAINRISKGKPIGFSATTLLIESILKGFIEEENLTATAKIMDNYIAQNEHLDNGLDNGLMEILNEACVADLSDEQKEDLVKMIIFSVDSLKKK